MAGALLPWAAPCWLCWVCRGPGNSRPLPPRSTAESRTSEWCWRHTAIWEEPALQETAAKTLHESLQCRTNCGGELQGRAEPKLAKDPALPLRRTEIVWYAQKGKWRKWSFMFTLWVWPQTHSTDYKQRGRRSAISTETPFPLTSFTF